MEEKKRQEVAAELLKAKQELLMKRRKLRRYDKILKTKKHVHDTLMKHSDEFQRFEIEQSGIPAAFKDAEVNRTVTFRVGSPDIINASLTSGESSRDSIDIKADDGNHWLQTGPSSDSIHLQEEDCADSPKMTSSPNNSCMNVKLGAKDFIVDNCDIAQEKIQNDSTEVSFTKMEWEEERISELGKAPHTMCNSEKEKFELTKDSISCKSSREREVQCTEDHVTVNDKMETSESYDNRDSETSAILEDVKIKRKCSLKKRSRCLQRSPGSNRGSQSESSLLGNNNVVNAASRLETICERNIVTPTKSERDLVAPHSEYTCAQTFMKTSFSVNNETSHNNNTVKLVQIGKDENASHFPDRYATGPMKKVSNEKFVGSVTEAEKSSKFGCADLISSPRGLLDDSVMDDLTQVCSDNEQSRVEIDLKESIQHYFMSYGKIISSTLTSVLYGKREVLYFILIQCKCVSLWTSEGDHLYLNQEMKGSYRTSEVPLQILSEQQLIKMKSVSKVLHSFAGVENGVRVQVAAWPGEEEVRFAVLQPCTMEEVNLTYFQYDASGSWLINSAQLDFSISTRWTAMSAFATGEWELTLCFHEKSLDTTTSSAEAHKVTEKIEERAGGSLLGADLYSIELDLTYSRKRHKWQLACDVQKQGKLRPAPASLVALQTTDESSLCCWLCDEGLSIFNLKSSRILCEVPIVNKEVNYNWVLHLAVTIKDRVFLVMKPSCSEELELLALNPMTGKWRSISSWTPVNRIKCSLLSSRGIYSLHEDLRLILNPFHS